MGERSPYVQSAHRSGQYCHYAHHFQSRHRPMKNATGIALFVAIVVVGLIVFDQLPDARKKVILTPFKPQQPIPSAPSGCPIEVRIKKADVGTIEFAAIPAMIDGIGMKITLLDQSVLIYSGDALQVEAFTEIASVRGWVFTKTENCN